MRVTEGRSAPIRYARSGDVSIAYQITGAGPLDLVLVPGFFSHLEIDWEHPGSARLFERLGSFVRLIRLDKRGSGLSDRAVGLPDLETRMEDVRAVMDAVGAETAVLLGYSEGGPMSVLFAATYPQRARALVLYGVYAKRRDPDDDYPWAPTRAARQRDAEALEAGWGVDFDLSTVAPSADPAMTSWLGRRGRASLSPAGARDLILMNSMVDVRALCSRASSVRPSFSTGPATSTRASARAATSPNGSPARASSSWRGTTTCPSSSPTRSSTRSRSSSPARDRRTSPTGCSRRPPLTDLVGSTERAGELGDAAWAALAAEHNATVRRELDRFAGEEIDTAGDGFFALFDGPARAIRCALAVREALAALGLDVRSGIHTGEVERARGEKPRGIAVHVAARIMALGRAGDVLVSATTHDLVAGSGLEFEDRGEHVLKGVDGPRRVLAAR